MEADKPFTDEQRKAAETVTKLLQLGKKNPNAEEAASAVAKAMDLADTSWELDSLAPNYMRDLITRNVLMVREEALWQQALTKQENEREYLRHLVDMAGGEL